MCACFLCIMRRQFEDLFICEKRHPKSAKKSTRKNWHLKSAKRGSAYVQKNYAQKLACKTRQCLSAKKLRAKIGTLNLQNEAAPICRKSTRKNWHLKSAKCEAAPICRKSTPKNWHVKSAKRGSAYLQKKYAQKLAR